FQSYALFPHLTIFNNIAYGPRVKKMPRAEVDRKVREIMSVVGLGGMENRHPGQMSGGQQQRVALARALVNEPAVLLFDEPLSNLDAKLRVSMRQEIRRIQKELGITSIYVTHDQEEAVCISDRIVVINRGGVEQIATPADLYERPSSRFVAGFFGKVNFVPGEVTGAEGDSVRVRLWDREFALSRPGHSFRPGQKVDAVLRPEGLEIAEGAAGDVPDGAHGGACGALSGVVTSSTYLGSMVEYEIDAGGVSVLLTEPNPALHGVHPAGERLPFRVFPETLHLLPAGA
ncbi:MAG: ABC transporter ATP-binding protein, partial [bacterium]